MDKQLIHWKKEYELGFKKIDDEHKDIIKLINKLYLIIEEDNIDEELPSIFTGLIKYSEEHFSTEEKYFEEFNYKEELKKEHIDHHRFFIEELSIRSKNHDDKKEDVAFKLISFLEDWLLDHIITIDKKYVECFRKHGVK